MENLKFTSKPKRFMFYVWVYLLLVLILVTLFYLPEDEADKKNSGLLWFSLLVLVFFMFRLAFNFIDIVITAESIKISNYVFRNSKEFKFEQLDGYIDSKQHIGEYQEFDVIFLISKGKKVAKINSVYIKNYQEMRAELPIKYLGFKKQTFADMILGTIGIH